MLLSLEMFLPLFCVRTSMRIASLAAHSCLCLVLLTLKSPSSQNCVFLLVPTVEHFELHWRMMHVFQTLLAKSGLQNTRSYWELNRGKMHRMCRKNKLKPFILYVDFAYKLTAKLVKISPNST